MTGRADRAAAARQLRSLLDAEAEGRLSAPGPAGSRLLRRLEGAVLALEAADPPSRVDQAR